MTRLCTGFYFSLFLAINYGLFDFCETGVNLLLPVLYRSPNVGAGVSSGVKHATMPQCVRKHSVEPKHVGSIPGRDGRLIKKKRNRKQPCFEISGPVKDPQVAKSNTESSTTARLIACVALAR